ncbi:thioredoxin domain-containing protein [Pseudonocardia eucalypti]|uniref:Thioredoxin domain-containing protein n=1 Tax=Pseudonocardia eucalypti TaxID=648755 RepID=A0ABP9RCH5_9PSEU|nr:protein-disulfide isomerase [Pseudonocardia eucalypti]
MTGTETNRAGLGIGIALAVVLLLGVISFASGKPAEPAAGAHAMSDASKARSEAARRIPGDPLALGDPAAPVVLVEFADYKCPYCAVFAERVAPPLIDQYVKTGKVRVEWRDFSFLGPDSTLAAVAARAAGRQGKFWDFHDALFAQHSEGTVVWSHATLIGLAEQLGLDKARFQRDLADPALSAQVDSDKAEGVRLGVNSTPTVLINGKLMSGSLSVAEYQRAIETLLAHAGTNR